MLNGCVVQRSGKSGSLDHVIPLVAARSGAGIRGAPSLTLDQS